MAYNVPKYEKLLNWCLETGLNALWKAAVTLANIWGSCREPWILFQMLFPWELHQHLSRPPLLVEMFLKLLLKCQCLCGETVMRRFPWQQPVPTCRNWAAWGLFLHFAPGLLLPATLIICLCKMGIKVGCFCTMLWALQRAMFQKN